MTDDQEVWVRLRASEEEEERQTEEEEEQELHDLHVRLAGNQPVVVTPGTGHLRIEGHAPRVIIGRAVRPLRASRPGRVLGAFSWFCRGETRENIRAAAGDLRKDVRDMRKQKCSRRHILAVRLWITTTTLVPVVWDGAVRISKKLPLLGSLVRAVSAFLRKIDPPKLG